MLSNLGSHQRLPVTMPSMEQQLPAHTKDAVSSQYWLKCTTAGQVNAGILEQELREMNPFWLSESKTIDYSTQTSCSASCPIKLPKFPKVMIKAELQRDGDTDTTLHMWRAEQGLGREMGRKMDKKPLLNCVERRGDYKRVKSTAFSVSCEKWGKAWILGFQHLRFINSTMGGLLLHGTQK